MTLNARQARFFIGTYNSPSYPGIYTATLDTETGALSPVCAACSPGAAENPSFLALSPEGKHLYACLERPEGALRAFRAEESGTLSLLNEQPTGGAGPCHVSASRGHAFAANYRAGSFSVFKLAPDGSLAERSDLVTLSASGPNPKRQQHSFGHSIYPVAGKEGRLFVYGCDLGGDHLECYQLDEERGTLVSVGQAGTPAGAGPRHLAFSPDERFVYCCNELDSTVTAFARDVKTGRLTALKTVSLLPESLNPADFGGAEIVVHPNGFWVYVSTRDTTGCGRDKIAMFEAEADGSLRRIGVFPATVKLPRGFGIDPTGRWLVVAGQADHRISVLKIDPQTGALRPPVSGAEVHAPVCILFAR